MAHRGPDASGAWESSADARGWGAMLAHRRLSILDLSPAGAQPMADPVTGHVIAFNGEIYNFQEIRERLAAEGQHFASTGDTAVMLRALGHPGARCASVAARDVRLRPLGPPTPRVHAGAGPAGHQAALPGAIGRSRRRVVDRVRLRGPGPARLGAARHASTGPAGRGVHGLERLRGRPGHGGPWHRAALARARRRVRRPGRGGPSGGLLDHPGRAPATDDGRGGAPSGPGEDGSAAPRQRRAAGRLPLRRRGLIGRGQPRPAGRRRANPHLHAGLRGAGAQRGPHRPADRPGHRYAAPGGGAHRGTLRRAPRGSPGQPRPADLRRAELLLHVAGHPVGRVHRRAGRHGRRRALRRLLLLPRSSPAPGMVPAARLAPAQPGSSEPPGWAQAPCSGPTPPSVPRTAGPSWRRCSSRGTTSSRSTSWPMRSSCPGSSGSCCRTTSRTRW